MARTIGITNNLIQDLIYSGAICGFIWWANSGEHSIFLHIVSKAFLYLGYLAVGWLILMPVLFSGAMRVFIFGFAYAGTSEEREYDRQELAQADADVRRLGVAPNTRVLMTNNVVDAVFAVVVCSFIWWANSDRHNSLSFAFSKAFLYLGYVVGAWLALMPFVFMAAYVTARNEKHRKTDATAAAHQEEKEEIPF